LYKQHHIPEAVEALRKAVKKNKADYEACNFLGLALIQNKDLKNATKSFERLQGPARFAAGQAGLAYASVAEKQTTEATRAAQAALRIDPGIAGCSLYPRSGSLLRAGAKEDALEHAEAVINLDRSSDQPIC